MSARAEHGSAAIMGAVYQLVDLRPHDKLYLIGFADSDDPGYLRRFACLTPEQAYGVRSRLQRLGWLREDGSLDLDAVRSAR